MKKLLLSLTILILVFQSYSQEKTGSLKIITEPGIYAYIDGIIKGKTNKRDTGIIINDLAIGRHKIMLVKPFHKKKTKTVRIKAGKIKLYEVNRYTPFSKKKMQELKYAKEERETIASWANYKKQHQEEFAYLNTKKIEDKNQKESSKLDQYPEFPGGHKAMHQFLDNASIYPKYALKHEIQGKIYVQFTIDCNGVAKDIMVLNEVHPALEIEALRIFKLMPRWSLAIRNGKPTEVKFTYPFNFILK